ncbi:tRNA (guanosine(37)-N1)-methyltransferase TrmD [Litorimonas sp. RW-G-Af-16]|uniref:tRNA (guanosine(37)-N1)-methyltransferase TrmD n=1 Tax=Litorimonas sp. RW-G-Af-16 TaxID=3241168 RepID=UPI00390C515B
MTNSSENPWKASVLTLFPDAFPGVLGASIIGGAEKSGIWQLETVDIRDFSVNRHRTVDSTPAGGGPGMVLKPDVAAKAIDSVATASDSRPLIYLTPRGKPLTQYRVKALAKGPGLIVFCGRFEGLDQRVIEARQMEEISIGDFVLAGGEVAAQAMIEACVRLLPGVLGDLDSTTEESFEDGLLEYPLYTKPREFEGRTIPDVLLSGDHKKIAEWRRKQQIEITKARRPDLIDTSEHGDDHERD